MNFSPELSTVLLSGPDAATSGDIAVVTSKRVIFDIGDSEYIERIEIKNDNLAELPEKFQVIIMDENGGLVDIDTARNIATVTIRDEDGKVS